MPLGLTSSFLILPVFHTVSAIYPKVAFMTWMENVLVMPYLILSLGATILHDAIVDDKAMRRCPYQAALWPFSM